MYALLFVCQTGVDETSRTAHVHKASFYPEHKISSLLYTPGFSLAYVTLPPRSLPDVPIGPPPLRAVNAWA